ncbi:integrin alpha-8-like [Sycon ciliatum]|uniref:integrin alpha-8-like n=1 Tax=Sycon ciliatum TaxID=27933 RepID=UPI0031F6A123
MEHLLSLCALLAGAVEVAWTFNLDTTTATRFSGPAGSQFGVSVSFHSIGNEKMLLVGAPLASYTNDTWSANNTLLRTGVLYRCPWSEATPTGRGSCTQLNVDSVEPVLGTIAEVKSDMRMGQTVLSLGPDSAVLVCASQYGKTLPCRPPDLSVTHLNIGLCFGNPNGTLRFQNLGKCVILPHHLQLDGVPQDLAPEDTTLVTPTDLLTRLYAQPSYWNTIGWGGFNDASFGLTISAVAENPSERFPLRHVNVHSPNFIRGIGRVSHVELSRNGTVKSLTQQLLKTYPNQDFAGSMSTAEGDFTGTGDIKLAYARPFATYNLYDITHASKTMLDPSGYVMGDVWIMDRTRGFANYTNANYRWAPYGLLKNHQFAEGFGLALLAEDVNNDRISELYVGAPYYMDHSRAGEVNSYDFGRVYVYADKLKTFLKAHPIQGNPFYLDRNISNFLREYDLALVGRPASRFGSTLAGIGDVDRDGYSDIAIAAPGEEVYGKLDVGAVYVYFGSASGLLTDSPQRIVPSSSNTQSFGSSLTYGWDIDSNGYGDIGIGALDSSEAFIYRSRPVISVDLQLNAPAAVDATNRSCYVSGIGTWRACFDVEVCAKYSRPILDTLAVIQYTMSVSTGELEIIVGTTTRSDVTNKITMSKPNTRQCRKHTVHVKTTISNFCRGTNISLTKWNLVNRTSTPANLAPLLTRNHPSIVPLSQPVSLIPLCSSNISKDSDGYNFTCKPDLVTAFSKTQLSVVSGRVSTTPVTVSIHNIGDQPACSIAVELRLDINTTDHLVFSSVEGDTWLCGAGGYTALQCQPSITNPHYGALAPGEQVNITVIVHSSKTPFPREDFSFPIIATASSTNAENDTDNNPSQQDINILRQSTQSLSLSDELTPLVTLADSVLSRASPTSLDHLPVDIYTVLKLRNMGPSVSTSTSVAIKYPLETALRVRSTGAGDGTLYYLTRVEASVRGVTCNSSRLVNARSLDMGSDTAINSTVRFSAVGVSTDVASNNPASAHKDCSSTACHVSILCTIPWQSRDAVTNVRFQWRVYTHNVKLLLNSTNVKVTLPISATVVNYTGMLGHTTTFTTDSASRRTEYALPQKQVSEPLDTILIAGIAAGSTVFIIVILVILFKCGFFARKKPEEVNMDDMVWSGPALAVDGTEDIEMPEKVALASGEQDDGKGEAEPSDSDSGS